LQAYWRCPKDFDRSGAKSHSKRSTPNANTDKAHRFLPSGHYPQGNFDGLVVLLATFPLKLG
jgi:hypothetical protein